MIIFLIVLCVVVFAAVMVLLIAATRPDVFRVQRMITINADAATIFPHINNLHNWAAWSPYEKLDPNMKKTFSGPSEGKGAVYQWAGNAKAGAGQMEIVDSTVPTTVVFKLEFFKPFPARHTAEFMLTPKGNATQVTWAMYGPLKFAFKILSVFMSIDRMIGKAFVEGLANLKSLIEK